MSKQDLYKASGVDVEKGDALVGWLKEGEEGSQSPLGQSVTGIGGFAALFRPNFSSMKDPLLISGTDGVGTKVLLGLEHNNLEGLGIDLVAMCVNDLYTVGGRPLFFLDYYATGILDDKQFKNVLTGIKKGLSQASCALMGGETAELPGLYEKGHFDLAGFVVGVVDGARCLRTENVKPGDKLIALESSGFHSNGYSLIRKWLKDKSQSDEMISKIMEPTRIYGCVPDIIDSLDGKVHGLANITGGGISGNLPRVMPRGTSAEIVEKSLPTPNWMSEFIASNGATFQQVEAVLNLGAGMIAIVDAEAESKFIELCGEGGVNANSIGVVKESSGDPVVGYC